MGHSSHRSIVLLPERIAALLRAIISDVHGNYEALSAVFEHLRRSMVREIICLGDIIGYGPNPRECVEALMDCRVVIRGNHEDAVMFYGEDFNPKAREALEWTKDQLNSPEHDKTANYELWNFLGRMEEMHREDGSLYVHGSPRDPTKEYIVPSDVKKPDKMAEIFDLVERVCFVGHSHIPGVYTEDCKFGTPARLRNQQFKIPANKKILVNVGSVGQPRDGEPRPSFVTFDGSLVKFHRIEYDIETTIEKIYAEEKLPNYLADRLLVGR
jgi:predicted phosphodiesterase